ncbi:hypothetical protein F4692_000606 [Nocardioides cavernae]|uniref:Uncharacterized protein n=1 Tax=Nocardioides cavernae TaxID=1921566 RepID=A0A7Y9KRM9_9ACTN|nr:hypothetical protein [Nocardioides cavernae]NYE35502.1 hypothetical protein [Nocardioides cavernae]
MRTTRLIAGTVTAGLLGLTPIAIAAPSQAADNWTTTIVATPSTTELEYGSDLSISVDLSSSDGFAPGSTDGTVTLFAQEAGSSAWAPVATAENTYASFYDVKPRMNTAYKVVYSGFTDPDQGTYGDNYAASESAPFTVGVARKLTAPKSGFVIKGKLTPDGGKKKIVISVSKKQGKGYKKFKTIKTNKKGKYKVTLPKRKGTWYWNFVVKGDSKYLGTGFGWRTWVS